LEDASGVVGGSGVRIPRDMERDLRHAMDLESPFLSPALPRRPLPLLHDADDGNDGDDEVSLEEELTFPFSPEECSHVAHLLGLGLLSQDRRGSSAVGFLVKKEGVYGGDDAAKMCGDRRDSRPDDIFQEIFLLDEADLNLPAWLLPDADRAAVDPELGQPETSFVALPDKLTVQAATDEEDESASHNK
jgi:hypothetical protein